MSRYVALLRAVNLAGQSRLRMSQLREIAEAAGLTSPTTYIASGNLLFTTERNEQWVRSELEGRLTVLVGKGVRVFVRTAEELRSVVASNPFTDCTPSSVQAFFLDEPPPADLLDTVRHQSDERIAIGTREVFVAYGERGIGRSRLRIPATQLGTARNMNTVAKLAELAREM